MPTPSNIVSGSIRQYTIAEGVIGGALINGVLNAGAGYWLMPGDRLSLFGMPGIAADIVGMAFGIAFGTALLLTLQLRKRQAEGKITYGVVGPRLAASIESLPRELWRRATKLGVYSVLWFAPATILALWLAGVDTLDRLEMTWMKAVFAAVVGAIVTPPIALAALSTSHDAQG